MKPQLVSRIEIPVDDSSHYSPSVQWSPDSQRLSSTVNDVVMVWDAPENILVQALPGSWFRLGWSPSGSRCLVEGQSTWAVLDGFTFLPVSEFQPGHGSAGGKWSPDGSMLAARGYEDVTVWDPESGSAIARFEHTSEYVDEWKSFQWSPLSGQVATSGGFPSRKSVIVWDLVTGSRAHEFEAKSRTWGWSPDAEWFCLNDDRRDEIRIIESETGQVRKLIAETKIYEWHPDGSCLMTTHPSDFIGFRFPESGETFQVLESMSSARFSPDGTTVSAVTANTSSMDREILLIDFFSETKRGDVVQCRLPAGIGSGEYKWCPAGGFITTWDFETLSIWETPEGERVLEIAKGDSPTKPLHYWSPNGRFLAISLRGEIQVWQLS
jgi:hypothetical protein